MRCIESRKDFIESLKTKADSLKPEELFLIADLYMGGEVSGNVPEDRIEGMFWLKKSAEAGLPIAQYTLGFWCKSRPEVFELGKYIKQSQEEAFYWFKLSAEGGYVSAYFELGKAYKYGLGCEKDVLQAKYWLEKAVVEEGNAWAMVELQEINMSESGKKDK